MDSIAGSQNGCLSFKSVAGQIMDNHRFIIGLRTGLFEKLGHY